MSDRSMLVKKTFLVSFLLPYLLILLLPVSIGCFIYFKSLAVITDEINRSDEAILAQIQESIDSRLRDVEQLTTRLGIDSRIKSLMNTKSEFTTIQRYTNYGLLKEFNNYTLSNQFLGRIYIYFRQPGLILSTQGTFGRDDFYRRYYDGYELDSEAWNAFIDGYHPNEYFPLDMKNPQGTGESRTIVFAKSIFPYVSGDPDDSLATIVIHLNNSAFQSIWSRIDRGENRTVLILNKRNQLLYSTGENAALEELSYDKLPANGITSMTLNGEPVTVSSIQSDIADWKYVSVIPSSLFLRKAVAIRNLAALGAVLVMMLGGLLALLFSRKNYHPIRKLMGIIGDKSGLLPRRRYNEVRFIEESVSKIVLDKQLLEEKHRQQNQTLRDHFLVRLIKGKQGSGIALSDLCETYNIRLQSDQFAVLLFYLKDVSGFSPPTVKDKTREEELVHFVVKNIMEDYVRRQNHNAFVVEVEQFLVCLVNFGDREEAKQRDETADIAAQALHLLETRFGIVCSLSVSRVHHGLEAIRRAYEEAIEAIEYSLIIGGGNIVHYADIKIHKPEVTDYGLATAKEYRFANCIKAGDYRGAKDAVSEMILNYSRQVPITVVKCNMFALIHLVLTSLGSISVTADKEFLESLDPIGSLLRCRTLPELEREIGSILDRVEQYAYLANERNRNTFIDDVLAFTKASYGNPDLSVSMIADHFEVNLPYLSRLFKQHTGEGLLEYIQKARIDKAKELLAAGDVTIKDAAMLVGYENRDTFIRLFKKYEGVTPGKYKG